MLSKSPPKASSADECSDKPKTGEELKRGLSYPTAPYPSSYALLFCDDADDDVHWHSDDAEGDHYHYVITSTIITTSSQDQY